MDENLKAMNFDLGLKNISDILTEVSGGDDFVKKSSKLDVHVHALEEELKKIEAFKRELPHCMHLLKHAIERLKAESGREVRPEEFTVLRNDGEDGRVKASTDLTEKKNWMSSVQLCTPVSRNQDFVFHLRSRFVEGDEFGCKFRNEGGAFLPFKRATAEAEVVSTDLAIPRAKLQQQEQQKKQRRCWSLELHKIFVDALHQLGGAQTATPKQIRELMKVEGLTNDEVKSHLQKYRIHIKRVDSTEQLSPHGPLRGG
ncbi:transcription factor HHO5-like [Salvia miltiorrhiza]|uniref:transcription factor HHO5-like n=1 Tax=Salvia miltiorrhiza TaxID=226208 RepID=UPI0025AD4B32|nr:transcription factor HHO5-like [Salvia miltiorrhiza]